MTGDGAGDDVAAPIDVTAIEEVERRGKGWLTVGTLVNGLTAYLFVVVGTRTLGEAAYAPVAVVWTSWTLLAAAVTVPVQHLVVVRRAGGRRFVTTEVAGGLAVATALLLGGLLVVGERLFTSPSPVHPIAVAAILVGAFVLGISRGRLAATGDLRGLGWSLALEGLVRLVVLAPVLLLAPTAEWVVVALLSGLASLFVPTDAQEDMPSRGVRTDVGAALLFGAGNALAVTVLAAGPLVLPLIGAAAGEVTAFFTTVALLRAPYLLLTGVSPRVSDALLRARAADSAVLSPRLVGVGLLVATTVLGAAAVVVGPPLIRLVFGPGAAVDAVATGLLAAAHVLALATLVLALVPVTVDRPQVVTRAWGPGAVLWLVVAVTLPTSPILAVASATLAAEALVTVVLLRELARWSRGRRRMRLRGARPSS